MLTYKTKDKLNIRRVPNTYKQGLERPTSPSEYKRRLMLYLGRYRMV